MLSKSLFLFILLLSEFFTPTDGLFGSSRRRRRRRQERQKEHQRKLRRLETQKELRSQALSVIDSIGVENAPYWATQCADSLKKCSDPQVSGYKFELVLHQFKECDHRFWEWENCTEICQIDRTTPGNNLINCVPSDPTNSLVNLVFTIILVKIFLSVFH